MNELKGFEPVKLDHIACIDDGELRYMSGRKAPDHDCELYAMPDGSSAPTLYPAAQLAAVVQQRDELLAAAKVALEAMESTGMLPASQYKLQAAIAKVQP